ncbi:MAG TPA: hypothetical protein VK826_14425, partial [Bacteroidia bacterium]|nr:hypothetical protein [Bacteroidia bacterium]
PLTRANAAEAIGKPATLEIPGVSFASPPFVFSSDAMKTLLDFLTSTQGVTAGQYVEPVQLQIICHELEERVINGKISHTENGQIIVRSSDIEGEDGLRHIIGNFYQKQLTKLQSELKLSPESIRAVRNVIENDLIAGERRVPVAYTTLTDKPNVSAEAIDLLIREKLLKSETSHSGTTLVELSHDTLVKPIIKFLEDRKILEEAEAEQQILREEAERIHLALLEEAERDRQKLIDDQKRASKRRKRLTYGIGGGVAALLVGFVIYGLVIAHKETQEEIITRQTRYYDAALLQQKINPTLAYRIAYDGNAIDSSHKTFEKILGELDANNHLWLTHHLRTESDIRSSGFSREKKQIMAIDEDAIYQWNEKGVLQKKIRLEHGVGAAKVMPNGKAVILCHKNYSTDTLCVYNENGQIQNELVLNGANEGIVPVISDDGTLVLWDDAVFSIDQSKPRAFIRKPEESKDYTYYEDYSDTPPSGFTHSNNIIYEEDGSIYYYKVELTGDTLNAYDSLVPADRAQVCRVTGSASGLTILTKEGNIFTYRTKSKALIKTGQIELNGSCGRINSDGKFILTWTPTSFEVWDTTGAAIGSFKQKTEYTSIQFSDFGNGVVVGSELFLWTTTRPAMNEFALYSPYDYHLLGLTENDYNVGNIYDTSGFDGLLNASINYSERLLAGRPDKSTLQQDSILKVSINESMSLYKKLFAWPEFSAKLQPEVRKQIYWSYAAMLERTAYDLYDTESGEEILFQYSAMADSLRCVSIWFDTSTVKYTETYNLSDRLCETGQYFKDSLRQYDKAIECLLSAQQLTQMLVAKYPTAIMMSLVERISFNLALCYRAKGNTRQADLVLAEFVALIEKKIADSTLQTSRAAWIYSETGVFFRDSLGDQETALKYFEKWYSLVGKTNYTKGSYYTQLAITYLYIGLADSADLYATKALQLGEFSEAYAVKINVMLLKKDPAGAKREYNIAKTKEDFTQEEVEVLMNGLEKRGRQNETFEQIKEVIKKEEEEKKLKNGRDKS